ncbi:glutamate-1-semialdehyde 2,1-aminomutase [Alicyclobacillus sp. SO9]|nr:glutamate-1-semialdehyde 2,1-aminomutase [Alicyclobacillus sp. SO9]
MPGGVNSPVRAYRAVGGTPVFADHGEGPYVYDIDGNRYIDYLLSWGPLMWGHAHPEIVSEVTRVTAKGTSFGMPTELETQMAEMVVSLVPSIEVVRMVNSGTEATMSALRLARAYTNRPYIVKFEGCYHGHADSLLVKAGSGVATFALPDSPGVPGGTANATLTVPYNNLEALNGLFQKYGSDIAAVIVEPVAGNMGCVLPNEGYLEGIRTLTEAYGSLLIFDEVMTGFRVSLGGAGARFNVKPDLTTLGKVIGAGLPVGAYGGRRDIMEQVAPAGPVYQAGTLSGNPLAMAAGLKSLQMLKDADQQGVYQKMQDYGQALVDTFVSLGREKGIPVYGHAMGAMFGLFFHSGPVTDFDSAMESDKERFGQYFQLMLTEGVSIAPSQLESGFVSAVHTTRELEYTQAAMKAAFQQL